ncbi:MAG: sensor histidine kinase [Oscillospiraceae bacterium]|nr:sensor histidine kinase [Oscillospiraceae bacterium]
MLNPIQKILNIKFRNKLILMCVATLVPVILGGVFLLYNFISVMRNNAGNEAISEADSIKIRLKDTVTTVSNISDTIFESDDLNTLLKQDFVNNDEYYNFYMQELIIPEHNGAYPQIDGIYFYLDIEDFIYNSDFSYANEQIQNSYWYKTARETGQQRWQLITFNGEDMSNDIDDDQEQEDPKTPGYVSPESRLAFITPLTDKNDDFCGTMVVTVNPDWYSELTNDVNGGVVFCVNQGVVFYSTVDGCRERSVLNYENDFPLGISDSEKLNGGKNQLEKKGYTVVSYFDYENTGNLFQIYVVKPSAVYNETLSNTIIIYVWYSLLCIILSVLVMILFASMFTRRIRFLQDEMHSVADGSFELTEDIKGNDEIYDLYQDLKKMVNSMQKLINDAYKSKIQSESFKLNQMEAEFKALASQINPHFLYNTLETIRMKAYCNNDKETADLVKKLGKFMRRCLEVKDGMVTLESELEFTRSYLELQAARFGDRVSYSIYCEVDRNYKILPLIIQPIVENAVVHGIESSKSNGRISIKVRYCGENVSIDVADNGQGIPPERMKELLDKLEKNDTSSGKSIGLTNVNKRIKMYHGAEYGLSVKTVRGKGTTISVTLPRIVDENVMKKLPQKYSEISENISRGA